MKESILSLFLIITLLFGACGGSENSEKKADPKKRITKLDTDKDGKINLEEYLAPRERKFKKVDKNNDGLIQKDEMKKKKKSGSGRKFIKIDANNDKQITMEEWLAPREKKFKKMDSNQDGFLTVDEVVSKKTNQGK